LSPVVSAGRAGRLQEALLRLVTYGEGELVAPVLQFVVTGVEGEGLHDVGPGPQELPVQLSHWNQNDQRTMRQTHEQTHLD